MKIKPISKNVSLGITSCLLVLLGSSRSEAYNFTYFGGRQGRAGVTDSQYTWNRGASGGTLTWFLNRDQLTLEQADNNQFSDLESLIQPELNKWSLWLDLSFAKAANLDAANVKIEFETTFDITGQEIPKQGGAGAATQIGNVLGNTFLNAEIGLEPSNNWANKPNDFAYVILHEWGHILGLGDLYSVDHNGVAPGGVFEGEDFIDHGLPSINPLKTTGKGDNVMQTRGVSILDNDEIAGAQWLWGALGSDSIVTGNLQRLAAGFNANETANHHGPNTWHYRGTSSVAAAGGGTEVTIWAEGATDAKDVGPGDWNIQKFPNKVVFTSTAAYAGNFEFEINSTNPEGLIDARIVDNTPTDFTAIPQDNGPQLFPFPKIFGPFGGRDFGDAPNSYRTLLASDGPRYQEGDLQRLGDKWDRERDGQPTVLANGDDLSLLGGLPAPVDDEDGVIFGDNWVDVIFNILRPGENKYQLRAWWDTDKDGCFDHPTDLNCLGNELFINDLLNLTPGTYTKRYNVGFDPKKYYSRFRLTWDPLDLDVKPWGEYFSKADCTSSSTAGCISHGEVEDYAPIPEPSNIFGLATVLGLGTLFNRKSSKNQKQANTKE
jgi:hypothetical protein